MNAQLSDFNDLARIRGPEAVRQRIAQAKKVEAPIQVSEPEPLRRPVPPAEPYPMDALGTLLGEAAERIRAVVQAPDAVCAQSVLAAASLAVQAHADIRIDGRTYPLSLWCLTVAESGERKSAVDVQALAAHREFERSLCDRYRDELASHRVDLTAHKAASIAAERAKSETALRDMLAACGEPPESPLVPHLLCSEPTLEGLHKLYQAGRPSVGLFSDEGGQLFGGFAMNRENVAKSAAGLSKLWDAGVIDRVRAGDGAVKLYGRRLAMHVQMQPVIAERVLSDPVLCGQGFLARGLMTWPQTTAGTRTYREVDLSHDTAMYAYWSRMRALLERQPNLRNGTRQELEPRILALTPDAKALWIRIHDSIEKRTVPNGDYAMIRAWASKSAEHILRIAGVLSMVNDPDTGTLTRPTIEAATEIVLFHMGEAIRLIGTAEISPEIKRAEALLHWCHETGRALTYSRELMRLGPVCIRERQHLEDAMRELERAGWAIPVEGGMSMDGKPRRYVWRIRGAEHD